MTLPTDEFLRRFLLHVLPRGFHRIRHYGLFANAERRDHLNRVRVLLGQPPAARHLCRSTHRKAIRAVLLHVSDLRRCDDHRPNVAAPTPRSSTADGTGRMIH